MAPSRTAIATAALVGLAATAATGAPPRAARFGIITDVHYADYDTVGTRFYRDSLPKVKDAVAAISAAKADFMIELGDFKDTVCPGANKGTVPANCTTKTVGFIDTIEGAMAQFGGPRFHVLGNHDVDVLNQSVVLKHLHNTGMLNSEGHYAFAMPFPKAGPAPVGPDTSGCLVKQSGQGNIWVVHGDGTRNWLSGCVCPPSAPQSRIQYPPPPALPIPLPPAPAPPPSSCLARLRASMPRTGRILQPATPRPP
jgi:hypothetical protein